MLDLRTLAELLPDAVMRGSAASCFSGVSTDTRTVRPGDLFVALRGERFDGHQFIGQAVAAGAAGVVAEQLPEGLAVPALQVPSSLQALGQLAAGWRQRFALPVVAVTGSNGKTTVKEMIAAILVAHLGEAGVLATQGNLNNDIGVPLTLLRLRQRHRMAVIELGMNHPGEIRPLALMARPSVGLVLNAQREHQEYLDGPQATARENGQVFHALPADGVAVFPGDDPCTPIWQELGAGRQVLAFGLADALENAPWPVAARHDARPDAFMARLGSVQQEIRLQIAGRHSVRNALAAAACALALDIPVASIAAGLAAFQPVAGRLRRMVLPGGVVMIDDSYNANPDSMRAAIDVLADEAGPRLLVMGDMGETGAQSLLFHQEVGAYARERGIEQIRTVGQDMRAAAEAAGAAARHWAGVEDLLAEHPGLPGGCASVLIKGSRFMRMERIVRAWSSPATAGASVAAEDH